MYLKFVCTNGEVIRYNEVKKRIIIGMVRDYKDFTKRKFTIKVNKSVINITDDIKLLHDILITDFKNDFYKFESVYSNSEMYVSSTQQSAKNLLIMFGSLFLDIKLRQFYSVSIINSNVLLSNANPVESPHFYDTN